MPLENLTLSLGPFDNDVYVVFDPGTREAAVLDVGFEPESVVAIVRRERLTVRWLLATHAHYDHVAGMLDVQREVGGAFALHPLDRPLLERVAEQGSMFGLPPAEVPEVELALADGQRVALGGHEFEVRWTPGHSPGHVVFLVGDRVWGGDVLFRGSVGRTDLPGGDWATLVRSIDTQLFTLPDTVNVLPGHGPPTTIGHERRTNPFVGAAAARP